MPTHSILSLSCVESNNFEPIKEWPEVNKGLLDNKTVSIVVQIDGKKRGVVVVDKDTEEKTVMELISKELIPELRKVDAKPTL